MIDKNNAFITTGYEDDCIVLQTGQPDLRAHFYPELYRLSLFRGEQEERVALGYSGSRVLERLLQSAGELVDRAELLAHGWAGRVVAQGSLNQQIYVLRQFLADEKQREIIQTLPRRGYMLNPRFVVSAACAVESVPSPSPATKPVQTASGSFGLRQFWQRWRRPGLAVQS